MAVITIVEYGSLAVGDGSASGWPLEPPHVVQTAITSFDTSQQSAVFHSGTKLVRLTGDTAFHYLVGADPTATTACTRMAAGQIIDLVVRKGLRLAVIAAA